MLMKCCSAGLFTHTFFFTYVRHFSLHSHYTRVYWRWVYPWCCGIPCSSWFRCGCSPRSNCCLEFESRRHRWLVVLMCLSRRVARWFASFAPFLAPHVRLHLQPVRPHIGMRHLQPPSPLLVVHCNLFVARFAFRLPRLSSGDIVGFVWVTASEWALLSGDHGFSFDNSWSEGWMGTSWDWMIYYFIMSLMKFYFNTTISLLDIIHRPVFV
jgi:hypothetical protein